MGVRPSKIYGVRPKHVAYYFDRAVETYGRALEDRIRTVSEKEKNQAAAEARAVRELRKWLGSQDGEAGSAGQFRDPATIMM